MIDLYYWTTPNCHKITVCLEEMGIPYRIIPINIGKGDQLTPEFLAVAANNRVPAIVDHDPPGGGALISIFESGAILLYLAEKSKMLIPMDIAGRAAALQWLFWQAAGLGPMSGQYIHFAVYAGEKLPYAVKRYEREVNRLFGVLNRRLSSVRYVAGETYSIADIINYPYISVYQHIHQDIEEFPHLKRWIDEISTRPAVQRAYARASAVNSERPRPLTEDERRILFGQSSSTFDAAQPSIRAV